MSIDAAERELEILELSIVVVEECPTWTDRLFEKIGAAALSRRWGWRILTPVNDEGTFIDDHGNDYDFLILFHPNASALDTYPRSGRAETKKMACTAGYAQLNQIIEDHKAYIKDNGGWSEC